METRSTCLVAVFTVAMILESLRLFATRPLRLSIPLIKIVYTEPSLVLSSAFASVSWGSMVVSTFFTVSSLILEEISEYPSISSITLKYALFSTIAPVCPFRRPSTSSVSPAYSWTCTVLPVSESTSWIALSELALSRSVSTPYT